MICGILAAVACAATATRPGYVYVPMPPVPPMRPDPSAAWVIAVAIALGALL
jgi:hypothetical protein